MLKLLVCFVVSYCALGSASSNLRGNAASELTEVDHHRLTGNELFVNQHNNLNVHEKSMHELISKIIESGKLSADKIGKTVQEIPDVSYENFLVTRVRANGDCNGPVAALFAKNVGCVQMPGGGSMQMSCTSSTTAAVYTYTSDDCTTGYSYYYPATFSSCESGVGTQCVSNSNLPEFAEKEGLNTYKFHDINSCDLYAGSVLGFYPEWTNDRVDFDDAPQTDSGNGFDDTSACCLQSEISGPEVMDACPYPLCEENNNSSNDDDGGVNNDNGNAPARRLAKMATVESVVPTELPAVPAVRAARPERWWQSRAKTQYVMNSMKLQTYNSSMWFREYSLTQQRTNVCVHDEKLNLYVKTSCHGKRDSLVYQVYADEQCTLLVKKAEHTLSEAIPAYAKCAQSATSGDRRYSLTVCHNKDGVNFPMILPPPMVG